MISRCMISPRLKAAALPALFCLSGGAALGCQVAWAKMLATGLGHEMPAVLAAVGAFLGGMAVGAATLDRAVCRSARPGRWYAGLEILIAAWGCFSVVLLPAVNDAAPRLIGLEPSPWRHWAIAFALPFLALLPATAAMGASLPAMERFAAPGWSDGRCVGALYAANTAGAVTGVLAGAFWIVPALGLSRSVCVLAQIHLLCGVVALFLDAPVSRPAASGDAATPAPNPGCIGTFRLRVAVFLTGLLGIGYEVAGVRVLAQVLENTVYTYAAALAVFLLATALGAAVYQRWWRRAAAATLLSTLWGAVSLTCALGVFALARAQGTYTACRDTFGDTMAGVLAAEMAVSALVFAPPAFFMGAVFSHLLQLSRRPQGGVGRATAWNTLGGALAPALFGVGLLPLVGGRRVLTLIALGYLALLPAGSAVRSSGFGVRGAVPALRPGDRSPRARWSCWRWALPAVSVALLFALPVNLRLVQLPPGGKLAEYREGVMASVAVIEDAGGERTLRVNNRFQMGGTAAAGKEYLQAHVPLLLHPGPNRALFLGTGTGITLGAATVHPQLQSDGVELVPEVVAVMARFAPENFSAGRSPHVAMHVADARRFVRATTHHYDVIVADLFHPARDGAGSLYTVEHFRALRARLAPGGLVCQWLPLHQLDEEMLRIIVRTYLAVFPEAQAWLLELNVDTPVLGLIGGLEPRQYSEDWVERRPASPALATELKRLAIADSVRFFGGFLAGPQKLRAFAGDAPLNTDDRPRVTFGAPRFVYQHQATSYGRLMKLLDLGESNPWAALGVSASANAFAQRLERYRQARDVYLRGLIADAEGQPARAVEAFIESARLSEDFTAGYAQCLTRAALQTGDNPAAAKALLRRLVAAQPARPVAREMLERLDRE
jgi:spermidine synthase